MWTSPKEGTTHEFAPFPSFFSMNRQHMMMNSCLSHVNNGSKEILASKVFLTT